MKGKEEGRGREQERVKKGRGRKRSQRHQDGKQLESLKRIRELELKGLSSLLFSFARTMS